MATDFSRGAGRALDAAVRLCRLSNARLTILHVSSASSRTADDHHEEAPVSHPGTAERQALGALVDQVRVAGVHAEGVLAKGDPDQEILRVIRDCEADLAVIGTHELGGLRRLIFGSTAEAVFRRATCPVLTVGPGTREAPVTQGRPVVFATDFHEPATDAVRHAIALANTLHTTLHGIHVLPPSIQESKEQIVPSIIRNALRKLIADGGTCERVPVTAIVYGTTISQAIVDYAREQQAEAIVLAVRRSLEYVSHMPPQITGRIISDVCCPVMTAAYDVGTAKNLLVACL